MGINQCTSIQNNKQYIDFFETKLKSSTSVIQLSIVNEYNEIKHQILKKRKLKDLSYIKVSTKYKSISGYISLEKQKDIFHQWFSLIGNNIISEEKKGEMIKRISTYARQDLEEMTGDKIFLTLWVRVKEDWRDDIGLLNNLGYNKRDDA